MDSQQSTQSKPSKGKGKDLSTGGSQAANPSTPTSNANATTPTSNANANANASKTNPPAKKAKKLTTAEAKQAPLNERIGSYMDETKEVMMELVHAVGFDQRFFDKRQRVFGELEKLHLEMEDMLTANAMILATEQKVDEFYSIPEWYRQHWVGMLLQGKLNQHSM
ncbi:hypothetical protein Vadar_029536 [Vaccinium darrowii]|uniref:Uncharacterized protein n=1 Tax=Vaccinium darrowii TaxID=229202 RepID=A0ACB7Y2L2_9ERIC|nr:hypothetical protein Vadar_029536 [Vaccinium darrowii]